MYLFFWCWLDSHLCREDGLVLVRVVAGVILPIATVTTTYKCVSIGILKIGSLYSRTTKDFAAPNYDADQYIYIYDLI